MKKDSLKPNDIIEVTDSEAIPQTEYLITVVEKDYFIAIKECMSIKIWYDEVKL